jgi:hypothetical protein
MVAYGARPMDLYFQSTTTSTTEAPRIVGDPLPVAVVLGSAALLLVVVLLGGIWLSRRASGSADPR